MPTLLLSLAILSSAEPVNSSTTTEYRFYRETVFPGDSLVREFYGQSILLIPLDPFAFNITFYLQTGAFFEPYAFVPFFGVVHKLKVRLAVNRRAELAFWVLPSDLCASSSVLLNTSALLTFRMGKAAAGFCAFTQTHFRSASMEVTFGSSDPHTDVEFFSSKSTVLPTQHCQLGHRCSFRDTAPFFLRVNADPNSTVELTNLYRVRGAKNPSCSAHVLELAGGGHGMVGSGFMWQCTGNSFWGNRLVVVGGVIGLAWLAKKLGIVGALLPNSERKRFELLKSNPYAPFISESDGSLGLPCAV
jgi:hypothetical protein